jgi:hypothetical protein
VQRLEHPGLGPLVEPPSGRRWRVAAKLSGRQQPPGSPGADYEHDGGERVAVGDGALSAAVGWAGW